MNRTIVLAVAFAALAGCRSAGAAPARPAGSPPAAAPPWEATNPVRPLPEVPLGSPADFSRVPWVTPEKVRLGRWLFYDGRLSADRTVSCATCHRPDDAFSEPEPVSTGIHGLRGRRKSPPLVNVAFPVYPVWFWDGRARSLPEQAKGPIENPIEMGSTMPRAADAVAAIRGYRPSARPSATSASTRPGSARRSPPTRRRGSPGTRPTIGTRRARRARSPTRRSRGAGSSSDGRSARSATSGRA